MSEMTLAASSAPRPVGLRAAALLGGVLLVGLVAMAALLAHDREERTTLETSSQTTAVGDIAYLKHRSRDPAPEITLQGQRLVPPSPRHLSLRDTRMVQAGATDGGAYRLYTAMETVPWEKGEIEDQSRPVYYLKIEPNEYLRVQ